LGEAVGTLGRHNGAMSRGATRCRFPREGIRIAAPVLDERFYDKFFAHEIMWRLEMSCASRS
jgi:hypothetical protein